MIELGTRLREVRTRAGISQIKLSQQIGFGKAHGYKYIYRLEKGLVPNPTLRTVAAFLEACRAGWNDLLDVLPLAGSGAHPDAVEAGTQAEPDSTPVIIEPQPPPAAARPRDGRPAREHLRQRRIAEHADHARSFWERAARAEERVRSLLLAAHLPPSAQRAYLAHCRSVCAALDATAAARAGAARIELTRLRKTAVESGLDPATIDLVDTACTAVFRPDAAR